MSARTRMSVCAAAATLLTACALLPLVDTSVWLLQAVFLLAVQAAAGAVARRVPPARPLTVLSQAVVTLLLLTLVCARKQAVAGLVPTPESLQRFVTLLELGRDDVRRYAIPAPLTDGIQFMLIGGVLLIGLAVDALAVTFRSAAPAGLPLLALYAVAAGLSQSSADWLWFLLAAAGYLLLLLAEGRDRLSRWGRVFSGAPRPPGGRFTAGGAEAGGAVAPVRAGRRIGAVALGIALVVPLALPGLNGGLLDPAAHGGGVGPGGGTVSAVNPLVSLQDSLNQPEDRTVLTYRTTPSTANDQYLRIVSEDDFDGSTWKPAVRHITDVPKVLPAPQGLSPAVHTTEVRTAIKAADWYAQDWLPMPFPASQVSIGGRWRYEPVGRTLVGDRGQTTKGASYEVTSLAVAPTARQLADAPKPPPDVMREFAKVPPSLPQVVSATARGVTKGAENDYERAVKLQDWFALDGGFTYNTSVHAGRGPNAIARFLQQKEGFCVHFSFAMAAMARTLGIPARVAVGFTPGTLTTDGAMSVGLRDAHAWPELYFEGIGWTRFEPTPNRGSLPDYTRPDTPSDVSSDPSAPSQAEPTAPSSEPTSQDTCSVADKRVGSCDSAIPGTDGGSGSDGPSAGQISGIAVAALALLVLPLVPMLWRIRIRARRLGEWGTHGSVPLRSRGSGLLLAGRGRLARAGKGRSPGGPTAAPQARWAPEGPQQPPTGATVQSSPAEAVRRTLAHWREITDTAWDHGIVPDDSETPRRAAERIVRSAPLPQDASASVHRVASAVEQALYARTPEPVPGLADDVRRTRAGIRASTGRATRLRAVLAPHSAVRLTWTFSAWRKRMAERLTPYWPSGRTGPRRTAR